MCIHAGSSPGSSLYYTHLGSIHSRCVYTPGLLCSARLTGMYFMRWIGEGLSHRMPRASSCVASCGAKAFVCSVYINCRWNSNSCSNEGVLHCSAALTVHMAVYIDTPLLYFLFFLFFYCISPPDMYHRLYFCFRVFSD